MRIGDAAGGDSRIPDAVEHPCTVQDHDGNDDEHRCCNIKENMDQPCPLGIRFGADGADDGCRNAVAHIDADDDGVNRAEGQGACDR